MNALLGCRAVLILLVCLFAAAAVEAQNVSCTVQKPSTSAAATSFAERNYSQAFDLYAADAKSNPNDIESIVGQVRSLLGEQQIGAAAELAEKSFAGHPSSARLATVVGEVRFRQGRLSDAIGAYRTSVALDPCLARTRYDIYKLLWIESMRASAYGELQAAHQLEPDEPDIHLAWIELLPLPQRSRAIDDYLATSNVDRPLDKQQSLKEYADRLRAILAGRKSSCHLVESSASTSTLPFVMLLRDPDHFRGLGFDIKVNDKAKARLELDTGASGILLNRNTARKAGLIPVTADNLTGIGDQKQMDGYWAFARDLRVGKLEFTNCLVEVSDRQSIVDMDGLIGADVFENYHVQLDFPLRRMTLSPLPSRPGESPAEKGSLNAAGIGSAAASSASKPSEGNSNVPVPQPSIRYTDRYVAAEMKSWSPFARFGHQILINGYLTDKKPRLFLVDSGANMSILSVSAAKSAGKLHSDENDQITGLNGRVKKVYTADKVDVVFAGLRDPLRDVLVMNLDALSKANGTEVSGILGLETLMVLTVDIDYRDGLIYLAYDPKHGTNLNIRSAQ